MCFSHKITFRRRTSVDPIPTVRLSEAALQARAVIPSGLVRRVRQDLERRISQRVYDKAKAYIARVGRNTDDLIRENRTYAAVLQEIQFKGLHGLDQTLVDFLRDHLNLHHAAIRSQQTVNTLLASRTADVLCLVHRRGLNIRNAFYVHFFKATRSEDARARLMQGTFFTTEFDLCAQLLQAEIIRQLTRLKLLRDGSSTHVELENVGPDHDVEDYGRDASLDDSNIQLDERDEKRRCCICLEPYTAAHTAFVLTQCGHTVGKSCLSIWLNGVSLNANSCPQCREQLLVRRALRPADLSDDGEINQIDHRLTTALDLLGELERLQNELFGAEAAAKFLWKVIHGVNYEFFQNDIDYCLDYEAGPRPRWGVRMVDWHS